MRVWGWIRAHFFVCGISYIIVHSLIPWSVLQQVHSFFLASSPISNILSFLSRHSGATYVFSLVFPSLLFSFYISFNGVFHKAVSTQDVSNIVSLPSVYSIRIFLSSLPLCNTSSLLTRTVQHIFSILPEHQISKLSRHFWSTVRGVKFSASYKAMYQM